MPNNNDCDPLERDSPYDDPIGKRCTSRFCVCLYMILPLLGVFLITPPWPRIYTIIMIVVIIPYAIWNMRVSEKRLKQLSEKAIREYFTSKQ